MANKTNTKTNTKINTKTANSKTANSKNATTSANTTLATVASTTNNDTPQIQQMPIIPIISKAIRKTKKSSHKKELNMDNIEQYIYSNRFSHVYLYSEINNESIKEVRIAIDEANKSSNTDEVMTSPKGIVLHINSPGGAITSGIGLMRIVARSRVPIIVYIEGISASAATFVSVLAKYRVIAPHASILIHQYASYAGGQRDELEFNRKVVEKMYSMMISLYRKHTKIPESYLNELLEHDLFLSPQLALEYGLVDKILVPQSSINIEKYFKLNPEYMLNKLIIDKKTNFNNIYLYGESEGWFENNFSKSLNLTKQLSNIIQKHPIYKMSSRGSGSNNINNLNSITNKGGAKPIVIHISDLGEFNNIYQILPIVNVLALCPIPTICIIDGPMNAICMLIAIMCNKAYIYHYAFITMNFVNFGDHGTKIGDSLYNTKLFIGIIQNLLRTYTKLPAEIINTILKKRYIFPANKCVEYGIVDGILND